MRHLTALAIAASLALTTAPASAQIGKPSQKDQVRLGRQAADEIRRKERVLPSDDERVRLVRRVGERLLDTIDNRDPDWDFSFDVIENRQVNAFALPGGPVFVYTGLLDKLETEDQLAGVMGHEITHVLKEHWARQYAENQKRGIGLAVLMGVLRANRTWQNVGGLVNYGMAARYSRSAETSSDDIGFDMMVQAGYNPMGMADVFRMFERQRKGGLNIQWLSSHPSDASRIRRIEQRITAMNTRFPAQRPLRYEEYDRDYTSRYQWWRVR